jgi:hypothetical protein
MRKDIHYLTKFHESHNLTDLIYYISFYAWMRLETSSESSASIKEEEITNTLVFEILNILKQRRVQLPIRFFHAKKERVNGNDLEIVIPIKDNKYIIMPCQAKRLYVDNVKNNSEPKYTAIHHLVNKEKPTEKEQICCLLEYAQKWGGFPLYLFYNYTKNQVEINEKYPNRELYGCTIASAYHVFENYKFFVNNSLRIAPFTFQDIHPPAKPLISLLDSQLFSNLSTFLGESISFNKLQIYKQEDLLKQDWWDETCPPISGDIPRRNQRIPTVKEILENKNPNIIEEYPFNPKYRIMILNKSEINRDINIE